MVLEGAGLGAALSVVESGGHDGVFQVDVPVFQKERRAPRTRSNPSLCMVVRETRQPIFGGSIIHADRRAHIAALSRAREAGDSLPDICGRLAKEWLLHHDRRPRQRLPRAL